MENITLPFSMENKVDDHDLGLLNCDLYKMLPSPLKEVTENIPHLLEYLHLVPISQVGIPRYCPELSGKMGDDKEPNFIYPICGDVFAHILVDPKDNLNHYISVEPTLTMNLSSLMQEVESRCIQLGDNSPELETETGRQKKLLDYIDQMTTLDGQPTPGFLEKHIGFLRKGGRRLPKIKVTQHELEGIRYLFIRDKIGMGVLEPLLADPYIEDISCSGLGNVFIEHKIFKSLKSILTFSSLDELDAFVLRMAERIRKPVSYRNPVADAALPDGSRINIVYGRDVSRRGSNFTIRKFREVPSSIFDMVDFGTLNYQMLAYLSMVIGNGMNVFVCGESASGKTTMLNSLTTFVHPLNKVITIEDTPELQVPHKNWIREVCQSNKVEDESGAITMFDLLKAALRQRPNMIMIGEIRGPEGNVAFQAMQTGHSVMATFHAASVEKLIQRITGNPISVPRTYIDNLNVVVLMSIVKLPNGKMGRRVTGIEEIVGYDPASESFNIIESFHWDETTDSFDFTGSMTSYILEYKIAPKLGIPSSKKQRIYGEVERRTKILTKLHKEQGVVGFYELLDVLGKAQREGLF